MTNLVIDFEFGEYRTRDMPDWRKLHPEKVCREEIVTEVWTPGGWMNEYEYCWNAKVRGFDKCWVHLTPEQKRDFRARATHD